MAADLELPKKILCHSHWTVDGTKMSKSKNNVIDPENLGDLYYTDGIRYFLLREAVPHSDGNFSQKKLLKTTTKIRTVAQKLVKFLFTYCIILLK